MSFNIIVGMNANRKKLGFSDNPDAREIIKIGKEINRMKACGEKHRIEREFGKEANAILAPKRDNSLEKKMARDFLKTYQEEK